MARDVRGREPGERERKGRQPEDELVPEWNKFGRIIIFIEREDCFLFLGK